MGNDLSSSYKGHKSRHYLFKGTVDYKELKYSKIAKDELYDLFLVNKIIHIDTVQDELEEMYQLKLENKLLREELNLLKEKKL